MPVLAQKASNSSSFSLDAQVRPRTEMRGGYRTPLLEGQHAAVLTDQRTRLGVRYADTGFELRVNFQDVRVWGASPTMTTGGMEPSSGQVNLGLVEAWASVNLGQSWKLTAGRQIISLDNERYFGTVGWAQTGRVHDALMLRKSDDSSPWKWTLGGSYGQQQAVLIDQPFALPGAYKALALAHGAYEPQDGVSRISGLLTSVQRTASPHRFEHTAGLTYSKKAPWSLVLEGYVQSAGAGAGTGYLLAGSLSTKTGRHQWTIGTDWLSGDQENTVAFSPSFGTNHRYYGLMDYFYAGSGHGSVGLMDHFVKWASTFGDGNTAKHSLTAHYFVKGDASEMLGWELDWALSKPLHPGVTFSCGASVLDGTGDLLELKGWTEDLVAEGTGIQSWGWIMLSVNPTLFSQSK